ncbi:hypothetical protein J1N35_027281 [Gossypium stocksii]|uniref:Uncharacterized protein n=1 Tax=Gossypium stocksii TaxID=47602 RepID=A0A9D3VC60_9ROSI|nr:hypothetical protein J1N35_027281 [Gossypium stocksii]
MLCFIHRRLILGPMAATNSSNFASSNVVFTSDRVVNSFPRHEVVKLGDGTFIQWQQEHFTCPVVIHSITGWFSRSQSVSIGVHSTRSSTYLVAAFHNQSFTLVLFHGCSNGLRCVDYSDKYLRGRHRC